MKSRLLGFAEENDRFLRSLRDPKNQIAAEAAEVHAELTDNSEERHRQRESLEDLIDTHLGADCSQVVLSELIGEDSDCFS